MIALATLWKMELQYYGKITCNFFQKVLAKNTSKGYEVWARKHNIKTMADSIIKLREQGINSITQLIKSI